MDAVKTTDEFDRPMWICTTPKAKAKWYVKKSNDGFVFYEIKSEKNAVAKDLQGKFLRPTDALKVLKKYFERMPVSNALRREEMAERMKASRNASKPKPDSQDAVQQGSSD